VKPIAFILNADWRTQRSGAATFTRALLAEMKRRGVEFCVVAMRGAGGNAAKVTHDGKDCSRGPTPGARLRTAVSGRLACGYLVALARDARHLWRHRRDLRGRVLAVNEFGCETMPIAARLVFPCAKVLALAHTHPGGSAYARHPVRACVERICYRSVDDIVFNSVALQREWAQTLSVHRMKGRVIHYGIAASDGRIPDDYPAKPEGCVDLLCASRFVRWKGHRELLQAFHRASVTSPMIRLILIGDGFERESVMKQARALGFADALRPPAVLYLGERPDAARYFNGADIGIQLSIEPEAFGLVFLEAMARGKPVIGTKIGGIPEVVGDAGLLVAAGDVEAAADAIHRLAESSALRTELGERGRHRWREEFTLERMVGEYVAHFGAGR